MKNYCYYHKDILHELIELEVDKPGDAYCDNLERKKWIDAIYGQGLKKRHNQKPIEYIQKKILEMGKKAGVKLNETKAIFKEEDFSLPNQFSLEH